MIRWAQRQEQTGSVSARPMGGSRGTRIRGADREWLLARIKAKPDLTLEEMRRELADQRGLKVGDGSVWRFAFDVGRKGAGSFALRAVAIKLDSIADKFGYVVAIASFDGKLFVEWFLKQELADTGLDWSHR